jgi:hypothetical protein
MVATVHECDPDVEAPTPSGSCQLADDRQTSKTTTDDQHMLLRGTERLSIAVGSASATVEDAHASP